MASKYAAAHDLHSSWELATGEVLYRKKADSEAGWNDGTNLRDHTLQDGVNEDRNQNHPSSQSTLQMHISDNHLAQPAP